MDIVRTTSDIFLSPSEAFDRVRERRRSWFPFLILFLVGALVFGFYFGNVDTDWLAAQLYSAQGLSADELEKVQETLSPSLMVGVSSIQTLVILLLYCTLIGAYFNVAAKVRSAEHGLSFKHWFALAAWAALPMLLDYAVMIGTMLVNDVRFLTPSDLNPAALSILLDGPEEVRQWGALLGAISVGSIWTAINLAVGYAKWTNTTLVRSTAVVATPLVTVLAIWVVLVAFV